MKRLKLYAIAVTVAAVLSWLLSKVYAMPAFTLLASPGVMLGLMAAGNTPDDNNVIIFFGNWLFYAFLLVIFVELLLAFRRMRTP